MFGELWVESRFYGVAAVLLVFGLVVSVFVVPIAYTWSEVCSRCGGNGVHTCQQCGGSGVCWVCGGDGRVLDIPEGWWCAACQGTGKCGDCGGDGVVTCATCSGSGSVGHWMYNFFGSSVILSVFDVFLFLGFFVADFFFTAFYLGFNEWVYKVDDMGFWFNRSFHIWLFAKDRNRWAKWSSGFSGFGAVYFGVLLFWSLSLRNIAGDVLAGGFLISAFVTSLFAWLFYRYYTSGKSRIPTSDYESM